MRNRNFLRRIVFAGFLALLPLLPLSAQKTSGRTVSGTVYDETGERFPGVGVITLLFANCIFILLAWIFERSNLLNEHCSKYIRYDNVNLVAPEKREELKADLEKRTGLKIISIEVGTIDFLKDSVIIRIFYDEEMDRGSSIANAIRFNKLGQQ